MSIMLTGYQIPQSNKYAELQVKRSKTDNKEFQDIM